MVTFLFVGGGGKRRRRQPLTGARSTSFTITRTASNIALLSGSLLCACFRGGIQNRARHEGGRYKATLAVLVDDVDESLDSRTKNFRQFALVAHEVLVLIACGDPCLLEEVCLHVHRCSSPCCVFRFLFFLILGQGFFIFLFFIVRVYL